MTIGTDTLATLTFPGSNGAALPAGWTVRFGTWSQNGSSGATYAAVAGDKVATVSPTRANDNYSIKVQGGWTAGSNVGGVILRKTNGTGSTSNGYVVALDAGNIRIFKCVNGSYGTYLAQCSPSSPLAWTNGATISVETVAGDVVITASSTTGGGQSCTYTDVAANSPYLTGDVGFSSSANSTPTVFTGPVVITGTAAASGPTLSAVTGSAADTVRQGSSFTVTGTGFGSTQSTSTITLGGASCTVTSWGDTSITATTPAGIMFTGTKTVTVTVGGNSASRSAITYLPPTGYIFEAITAVPVSADSLAYGVTGLAVSDEVWCNSAASPSGTVVFNGTGAGTVSITGVTVDGDYTISGIQVRDATDGSDTTNGPKTVTYFTGGTATGKTVRRMRHGFGLSF